MRKMKDSGIEWIGEIPEDWEVLPFRHVLQERNERNNPVVSEERLSLSIERGVTLYADKTTNLDRFKDDFTQYKLAYIGDLVMNSMNMIVGATGVSKWFGCVSPVYYTFYDNDIEHTTAKFCEYIFRSKTMLRVLHSFGKGIYSIDRGDDKINTCRLKVAKSDLKNIKIPIPQISEQKLIIQFLDIKCSEIDFVISKTRETIEEYKKLKQSIITEVVTGKVKIENGKVKESEMLELKGDNLPNGWRWMKLKFLIDKNLQYGANDSGIEYNPILPRYVRITDIDSNGKLKNDEMLSLSEENSKDYFLEEGDILFARSGASVGKTFIYKAEYGRCCFAGYLIRAKLNKKIINPQFFFYYTLSSKYDIWKNGIFIQSTIQNIGADKYSNLEVPVPPLNSQLSLITFLDKKCSEIDKLITKKEQLVVELESYKKSLIYEVVTGKRSV